VFSANGNIEGLDQPAVDIRKDLERQSQFFLKAFVDLRWVSRNSDYLDRVCRQLYRLFLKPLPVALAVRSPVSPVRQNQSIILFFEIVGQGLAPIFSVKKLDYAKLFPHGSPSISLISFALR
jgi:hypothetical protein